MFFVYFDHIPVSILSHLPRGGKKELEVVVLVGPVLFKHVPESHDSVLRDAANLCNIIYAVSNTDI